MAKSKRKVKSEKDVYEGGRESPNKAPARDAKKETRGEGGFRNNAMNNKR